MPVRCGPASFRKQASPPVEQRDRRLLFDATVDAWHAFRADFRLEPSSRLAVALQNERFRAKLAGPELDAIALTPQYRMTIAVGWSRLIVLVYGAKSSVSGSTLALHDGLHAIAD